MTSFRSPRALTSEQRSAAAEQIADAARDLYGLRAPIDPATWCRLAGVNLGWFAQHEEGRYLRPIGEPAKIVIQEGQRGSRRSHFTVAHELGHHLIEETRRDANLRNRLTDRVLRTLSRVATASAEEERLCDDIAGALLLPIATMQSVQRLDGRPSLYDLLLVASTYRTSYAATLVRYRHVTGLNMAYALCERNAYTDGLEAEWRVVKPQDLGLRLPVNARIRPVSEHVEYGHDDDEPSHRGQAVWFTLDSPDRSRVWVDCQRLSGGRYAVLIMHAQLNNDMDGHD